MEYETLSYDFGNLQEAIADLGWKHGDKRQTLHEIKNELNLFFKDFCCTEVTYTENTDNEFFGVQIQPMFSSVNAIADMFDYDNNVKFTRYAIEFDSKLFNGQFTSHMITALVIHDINKLNTPNILKSVVCAMDHIAMNKGQEIRIRDIMNNADFFMFALQDTVRKMTSAFEYIPADLSLADDFVRSYGLANHYEDGMFVVKKCRNGLKDQICSTTITLNWFMDKYLDLSITTHKDIAEDLSIATSCTGSTIVKRLLERVITRMRSGNKEDKAYYEALTEATKKKMSLASKIKYSGMKSLEDDVYEYRVRIKNIDTEEDAIYTVRQINNRLGVISDYLENEDLSDIDKERFYKLYDKYDGLREELSKKAVYNKKMYGLFVDYNALQQMGSNYTTMNTYY